MTTPIGRIHLMEPGELDRRTVLKIVSKTPKTPPVRFWLTGLPNVSPKS